MYSDHYLVRTRIRLKLARTEGEKIARERFDVFYNIFIASKKREKK